MLVVIAVCIILPEVVMNCLCGCIKLRGCVGLDQERGKTSTSLLKSRAWVSLGRSVIGLMPSVLRIPSCFPLRNSFPFKIGYGYIGVSGYSMTRDCYCMRPSGDDDTLKEGLASRLVFIEPRSGGD